MDLFVSKLITQPLQYVFIVLLMGFSICVHEFCHSLAALGEGDETGRRYGFMTMNPLQVMGVPSIVCLLVFGIAWGRVPIDPRNMRHRWGAAWVSFAGPLANLLLALVFTLLTRYTGMVPMFQAFFYSGIYVNVLLAVFNLLPIPTLDGWGILEFLCPPLRSLNQEHRSVILFVSIMLLWCTRLNYLIGAVVAWILHYYELLI